MSLSRPLLIVVATFNELESLPTLTEQLLFHFTAAHFLVIDDHSPDGTGDWCEGFSATQPRFSVVHRAGKLGLGSATLIGLQHAIENGFEFVATMDGDGSHNPAELRSMFDWIRSPQCSQLGAVIGSRYVTGGKIIGWPWYRRLSSLLVNGYSRFALGLPTRDNTSALRIYRTDALRKIDLDGLRCNGYAYLEEILWYLKNAGTQFAEHPVVFHNREIGRSKVNFAELGRSFLDLVRLSLRPSEPR